MKHRFGLQSSESAPHWAVAGLVILAVFHTGWPLWLKLILAVVVCALAVVTFDDRLASRWLALAVGNRRRPEVPHVSEAEVGSVLLPGEDVGVRWEGDDLVALVALNPWAWTPTTVVNGHAITDDTIDTALVEKVLAEAGFDVVADVISAGWRVARTAPMSVHGWYEQSIGLDPAPAFRRSWVLLRVDPKRVWPVSRWRGTDGIAACASALTAAATRMAETLSREGVDARVASSYALFDELTGIAEPIVAQQWSSVRRRSSFTTVFSVPGGPDKWWSIRADRTVTRTRVVVGQPPRSTVALTTVRPIERDPVGWIRLRGTQVRALSGDTPVIDEHRRLPIGSAGLLVGNSAEGGSVYVPFDGAECGLQYSDPATLVHVAVAAAAAGATVSLPRGYEAVAAGVGGTVSDQACVQWPGQGARTWLVRHQVKQVISLQPRMIALDRSRISLQPLPSRAETAIGIRI